MPGSTFKVLTTGVALDDGVVGLDSFFPDEREFVPPQTNDPIQNYGGTICGGDFATVFARSCNTRSPASALELGPQRFEEGMRRWGVGEDVPIDLPGAVASTVGDFSNIDRSLPLLAIAGSARTRTRWCRSTWRWWRPPSPTTRP